MSIAALIRAMAAAGAPAEAIAIAVEAIEAAYAIAGSQQRSAAAIRQERYRERKASQSVTEASHTVTDASRAVTPPSSEVSEVPPEPLPNLPNSIPKKAPKGAQKGVSEIDKPDDVSDGVWRDFKIHRKAKKAPITETVVKSYRREAAKAGIGLEEAMQISITRNWIGFDASWSTNSNYQPRGSPSRPSPHDQIDEFERRMRGDRDDGPVFAGTARQGSRADRRQNIPLLPGLSERDQPRQSDDDLYRGSVDIFDESVGYGGR